MLQERKRCRVATIMVATLTVIPVLDAGADESAGSYLSEDLPDRPVDSINLASVEDFDPSGGVATVDPGNEGAEVISYGGVDTAASALTGVSRDEPQAHAQGTFVAPAQSNPEPSPTPDDTSSPSPKPKPNREPRRDPSPSPAVDPVPSADDELIEEPPGCGDCGDLDIFWAGPRDPNAYSSATLDRTYERFLSLGLSQERAQRLAFAPFVVGDEAGWTDTWGAPREVSGSTPRRHEGQDIFCTEGAPLLAARPGSVEFAEGGLGGRVAKLRLDEGGYLYYAHLSDWNTELTTGDRVRTGDVIGYCGDTGNAQGGTPHLHLGWYGASGQALDPMQLLVELLRKAEYRSSTRLTELRRNIVKRAEVARVEHLFGDAMVTEPSELQGTDVATAFSRQFQEALGIGPPR